MFNRNSVFLKEVLLFFAFLKKPKNYLNTHKDYNCDINIYNFFCIKFKILSFWTTLLLIVNIFLLGPISYNVAKIIGAHHKTEVINIPIYIGILWAPLIEEMLFRYILLCNPVQFLVTLPFFLFLLLTGPSYYNLLLLSLLILICVYFRVRNSFSIIFNWDCYVLYYQIIFYLSSILFAFIHVFNFSFDNNKFNLFFIPFLLLPQLLSGLVLGWIRVSSGIFSSIIVHGLFNTGAILLIWILSNRTCV
ncbi:MAG: CPBP family intramembrane metalloprotease [Candidatus Kinetoplastibacterium crithidii]|nr:MAG: CPBP family intramembrane metalloprotease [Candidatus Kinetoplastibacterium crithidii]